MLQPIFLIGFPSGSEWIPIILIALLLFGGKKIPELMRGLGRGVREFNDAKSSVKEEFEKGMKEQPTQNRNTQSTTVDTSTDAGKAS